MTTTATALEELSSMLGIRVDAVTRDLPAHERRGYWLDRQGREVLGPARGLDGTVSRQAWHIKFVELVDGAGRSLQLTLTSDQIRNGRRFTSLLRSLGSDARIDNTTARRCLAVMHRVLEEGN